MIAATGGWEIATAVGTIAAVVVALGTQAFVSWRERKRRPRLTLTKARDTGVEEVGGQQALAIRLRVSNAKARLSADGVRVTVYGYRPQGGSAADERFFAHDPLGRTHGGEEMIVPANASRIVDLGRADEATPPTFELAVKPSLRSSRHSLRPGSYELWLEVSGRNADATQHTLQLTVAETWGPDCVRLGGVADP